MEEENQEPNYNEVAEQVGVHNATQQGNILAAQSKQLQYQMEESEQNLAEAQLDVNDTLIRLYHLLKQDINKLDPEKNILDWFPIKNEKRTLTDEGVDRIMQIVQFYINKETLLSNFDNKMINRRMLEFAYSFNALMFMKYEIYFRVPSLEECKNILKNRIEDRVKKRMMALELQLKEGNEKDIRKEISEEFVDRFDYEMGKIKEEKKQLNLREYEMLFTQVKALVESTHNRAWKGEERGSLRRHFNISEVIGGKSPMPQKSGGNWFGFGK